MLAACASNPDPRATADLSGEARDTELKHENCPFESSNSERVDVNGDGKPDLSTVKSGSRVICKAVDLNFDGAIDTFVYYDDQGRERRRESDFDRDGRPDEIAYYEGGVVVRKERETNFDDKIDTWDYYRGDRIVRRERDSDGDAIIDQWWEFNRPDDPKCAIVSTDRNTDGKPDVGSEVDLCGDPYTPAAAAPAPPPPTSTPAAPSPPSAASTATSAATSTPAGAASPAATK